MIKYLAPVLIIGGILIWVGLYGMAILSIPMDFAGAALLKAAGIVVLACVMVMAVKVLVDRIREIIKEDEDDYRQY